MLRRPPRSTRTYPLFPYTTLFRSFCCPGSRNAEFFHCFRGMLSMIRSLYLAGPDVFRPDARERGRELKALCAQFGIEGLFPLRSEERRVGKECVSTCSSRGSPFH